MKTLRPLHAVHGGKAHVTMQNMATTRLDFIRAH